ncbi:MAG: hypothetical protein ACLU4S_14730, partial [Clostridium perfringens]
MINSNDKIILDKREGDYKEDLGCTKCNDIYLQESEFRNQSFTDSNKLRCIKTMNSSFIDFYKTYPDEEFLLNKEVDLR